MNLRSAHLSSLVIVTLAAATSAHAQSNEVFLGQTGDTNILTVDQTGANNMVGGVAAALRLNQMGDSNTATILQIGNDNGIGRLDLAGVAGRLTGRDGMASGLDQIGDRNELDVIQRTFQGAGFNLLGAIRQEAEPGAQAVTNRAVVRQIGGAFDPASSGPGVSTGPGFHQIGEIVQIHQPVGGATDANRIEVEQTGLEQTVWQLRQTGAGNTTVVDQAGEGNSVRMSDQAGSGNRQDLRQAGLGNTVGNAMQTGDLNRIEVQIEGDSNLVDNVIQAGRGFGGGVGNSISISISGNDNGGEGIGAFGAMSAQRAINGAYAASLEQYGDDNVARLTIGSAAGGQSSNNDYSVSQSGVGNFVNAGMSGNGNIMLSLQDGDGNVLDIRQDDTSGGPTGPGAQGHFALVEQWGSRNSLGVSQRGTSHTLGVTIFGSDNFGEVDSDGFDHVATVDVRGDLNVFSIVQTGTGNLVTGTMLGNGNTALVTQSGQGNEVTYLQSAASGYAFVQQE